MTDIDGLSRLRRLADKDEIYEVLARYCRGIDRRDRRLIEDAFHPDGVNLTLAGEVSIQEMTKALDDMPIDSPFMHILGNHLVEFDGEIALSEAYFVSLQRREVDGQQITRVRAGRYLDRFERRDGRWRIARRTTTDDWSRVDPLAGVIDDVASPRAMASRDDPLYQLTF